MLMTSICAALPLSSEPAPHQLLLYRSGDWQICEPLEFTRLSRRQTLLNCTAERLRVLGKESLEKCAQQLQGQKELSREVQAIHRHVLENCLRQHRLIPNRLSQNQVTAKKIGSFFTALQRQLRGVVGQWDHTEQEENHPESQTRKLLECILSYGEAPFVKRDLPEWGAKLLNLQTQISRWPANFCVHCDLDFSPREVRSLDWLATICAYILADYWAIRPHLKFEIFDETLQRPVDYEVAERFDLVGGLWAFGLLPVADQKGAEGATPVILVRGTEKNPLKEGFWGSWWLNADPNFPGASLCTAKTRLPGHRALVQWLHETCAAKDQKALLVGHSLGGTISIGLAIFEHQFVRKAVTFNAPVSQKMFEAFERIPNPPQVLQFQNSRDPLCKMESAPIGRVYNLDFMESPATPPRAAEYWSSISHLLPTQSPFQVEASRSISQKISRALEGFFTLLGGLWLFRTCGRIEPIPYLCTLFRRAQRFPHSVYLYHSAPSTLKLRCIVQRGHPEDLKRSEWVCARLMFEWICRTWAFFALNALLGLHNLRRRVGTVNGRTLLGHLKDRLFRLQGAY